MSQPLYVFDLDNTLIDGDSSTIFSRFLVREGYVSDPEYLLHEERLMLDYARGDGFAGIRCADPLSAHRTQP